MFALTSALTQQSYDGEAGYYWQEALLLKLDEEGSGCIGWSAAQALPNFQVAVYKQLHPSEEIVTLRSMSYMAIILREK